MLQFTLVYFDGGTTHHTEANSRLAVVGQFIIADWVALSFDHSCGNVAPSNIGGLPDNSRQSIPVVQFLVTSGACCEVSGATAVLLVYLP